MRRGVEPHDLQLHGGTLVVSGSHLCTGPKDCTLLPGPSNISWHPTFFPYHAADVEPLAPGVPQDWGISLNKGRKGQESVSSVAPQAEQVSRRCPAHLPGQVVRKARKEVDVACQHSQLQLVAAERKGRVAGVERCRPCLQTRPCRATPVHHTPKPNNRTSLSQTAVSRS